MDMNKNFNGTLRFNPSNPRYFTDNTGKAIFLTGSHTWATMQDIWLENRPRRSMDYDGFLQMLEDYGHNFLRFWQWPQVRKAAWTEIDTLFDPQPYERTGPGDARDGLPKFDLAKWNEAYFARLRQRVEKAGTRGIYVSIMFFDGWGIKQESEDQYPWPYYPIHPDNNINGITDNPKLGKRLHQVFHEVYSMNCPQLLYWQKEFIKKIIDTVNDLDNVLYEIGNEMPDSPEAFEWMQHMCAFTKEYENSKPKQHPVGITAPGFYPSNEELINSNADWVSPMSGRDCIYKYNPPAADGRKVIITDTDHLWGHGVEIQWIWKSVTRGMNPIFMDPWEPIPHNKISIFGTDGGVDKNQRYFHNYGDARRNLGYARKMVERMDLNKCVPHDELFTSTYCLANPGEEYLCFLSSGESGSIDLWDMTGEFLVEWLEPATGKMYKGENFIGGKGYFVLKAPFEGMAVVYIRKNS